MDNLKETLTTLVDNQMVGKTVNMNVTCRSTPAEKLFESHHQMADPFVRKISLYNPMKRMPVAQNQQAFAPSHASNHFLTCSILSKF